MESNESIQRVRGKSVERIVCVEADPGLVLGVSVLRLIRSSTVCSTVHVYRYVVMMGGASHMASVAVPNKYF